MSTVQTFNDGTIIGYVVISKLTDKPCARDGHFKVYATKAAAQRRRYSIGSTVCTVKPIHATVYDK
jgi:hypothetical protein